MASHESVRVWDLPTRLFHWTLVLLVLCAWVSYEYSEALGDNLLRWHRYNGLSILILLIWRLMWGLTGSSTARFGSFVRTPTAAFQYGRDLRSGVHRRFLGHNPLGGWMVIALLAVLLLQAGLGQFAVDENDLTGGPLSHLASETANDLATRWHGRLFEFGILPLAALHILANVLYGIMKREPLIPAMVTGRKPVAPYEDAAEAVIPGDVMMRAMILLALSAAIVLGGLWSLGGKLT